MKRIAKLLARLYPSPWRNRYGVEYEALLDDTTPRPQDAFNILWEAIKMHLTSPSFVRIVLPCTIAGALIAAASSLTMPPRYVSQFTFVAIEVHGQSTRGAREVTEDEANRALSNLRDAMLDRDVLASTIQKFNLYPRERTYMPLGKIIDKMQKAIEIKRALITQPGVPENMSGFILSYTDSNPRLAQRVEQLLAWQMLYETVRRERSASGGFSQPHENFVPMEWASLPQKPSGWNPIQKITAGLFTGLLCGLALVPVLASRRKIVRFNS